ncbi:MAG TPA: hypothetical protein IAA98_04640 [Candidatus Avipropionibacterium avicola]|uniref:Mannosylglycerate hydrolase MGH1-like glycoside hydrolase domain-containing protein n=1 Tax=Candidatus Avipropionibacterium avicola TaxID=2840701 RepID=A0A9D1KN19_9ACTN|nr:hypothetical protein [Candidatus Avipropionibacterium avicola]
MGTAVAAGALARPTLSQAAVVRPDTLLEWVDEQVDFILSKQLSSGAVLAPDDVTITPYFVSWGLMGLARVNDERSRTAIGRYLEWYLDHLNTAEEDLYGFAGTVYVHSYDPDTGAETSTGAYSSVDAGVATPVMLARDAWATGDTDLQAYVLDQIELWESMIDIDVNSAPDGVAQDDGLCEVRPGGVIYVQDNAVVHAGMLALAELEKALGRNEKAAHYRSRAQRLRTALLAKLWSEQNQTWHWALSNTGKPSESIPERRFYPEGWAQYWPVHLDIVTPKSPKGAAAWASYTEGYPNWAGLEFENDFPHTEMALAAVKMGERHEAVRMLQSIRERYEPSGWGDNWYVGESGHFIRAALAAAGGRNRVGW